MSISDMSWEKDDFFNTLLAFLHDSGDSAISDNKIDLEPSRSQEMVVSGDMKSFSAKSNNMDLFYKKCNFSTILNISWTPASTGCITSSRVRNTDTNILRTALSLFRINQEKEKNTKLLQLLRNSLVEREMSLKPKSGSGCNQIVQEKNCEISNSFVQGGQRPKSRVRMCNFCLKNGESMEIYLSHYLKGYNGKITCPVLRRYTCEYCGATGVKAHTRKYCPVNSTEKNPPSKNMII